MTKLFLFLPAKNAASAAVGGVHGCVGPAHGTGAGDTSKTVPPQKTAHLTSHGRQEETTVS